MRGGGWNAFPALANLSVESFNTNLQEGFYHVKPTTPTMGWRNDRDNVNSHLLFR